MTAEDLIRESLEGRRCWECGEEIDPGEPCAACADKAVIIAEVFPELRDKSRDD